METIIYYSNFSQWPSLSLRQGTAISDLLCGIEVSTW